MINKIEELAFVVHDLERKIEYLQHQLSQAHFRKNTFERKELKEKERIAKRQIQEHIKLFRNTISDNNIALKLFSSKLDILEKKYHLQPQINNAAIYCLNILKDKHATLHEDQVYFMKLEQDQEVDLCNREMELIEIQSKLILKEFHANIQQNPNELLTEESEDQLKSILHYYRWDFETVKATLEKRKSELEVQLEELSENLKSIIVCFNYQKADKIIEKIKILEQELYDIKVKINGTIDYIL
ncbi:hypothetical protein [Flavobacterium sp. GP15]|uniref:hypothetical protein n=1 Tax=Flavobacterium sp. GP15 TaxID=2758567 RepID=UPI00165DEEA2|nr:hypothetical protein [Flavobacterium sp. GP15]